MTLSQHVLYAYIPSEIVSLCSKCWSRHHRRQKGWFSPCNRTRWASIQAPYWPSIARCWTGGRGCAWGRCKTLGSHALIQSAIVAESKRDSAVIHCRVSFGSCRIWRMQCIRSGVPVHSGWTRASIYLYHLAPLSQWPHNWCDQVMSMSWLVAGCLPRSMHWFLAQPCRVSL